MMDTTAPQSLPVFPLPLDQYPAVEGGISDVLLARIDHLPFNAVATAIFLLAVLHTFFANRFRALAHHAQHEHDARRRALGLEPEPSFKAEMLHFLGEVEVIFGLWVLVLMAAITGYFDWETAKHYVGETVNYTEALFVVVIMAIASTQPVVGLAESLLRRVAAVAGGTPAAWWLAILTFGPVLGSFITEPAAMTICALLLGRQFFACQVSRRLQYATLGLLFVNVSIGGTLTHFAAPPVLMVARPWDWNLAFMSANFGWKAVVSILTANAVYFVVFRRELATLAGRSAALAAEHPLDAPEVRVVPSWVTGVHLLFLAWTVAMAHYPVLFLGGFMFFLGFAIATAPYQTPIDLKPPLLVGFFLAGLVTHGGLQGWWIAPVLGSLTDLPLFAGAVVLTAFNDNALITYLATLVPGLSDSLKYAVVAGAVTGGGLTVIANAPNPAGQALLGRFFEGGVSPAWLLAGALVPTGIATACFLLLP
ncbi:MAG: putative Na+/H+ antiporter [Acidobacteriota bacterium]